LHETLARVLLESQVEQNEHVAAPANARQMQASRMDHLDGMEVAYSLQTQDERMERQTEVETSYVRQTLDEHTDSQYGEVAA